MKIKKKILYWILNKIEKLLNITIIDRFQDLLRENSLYIQLRKGTNNPKHPHDRRDTIIKLALKGTKQKPNCKEIYIFTKDRTNQIEMEIINEDLTIEKII